VSSPTDVAATFTSVVSVEEDGAGTRYAWGRSTDPRAIGGSYRWERRTGASATYDFSGGTVTLFTVSGPVMGKARVRIDGAVTGTFDGFARTWSRVKRRFEGLGPGAHVLSVEVLGAKRPAAVGTRVAIDALRWGGQSWSDPPASSVRWATAVDPGASGEAFAISDARGASAKLAFTGTGVALRTQRGPGMGKAEVRVDGVLRKIVDLYAPSKSFATVPLASELADGVHTVRIVVLGSHRGASSGSAIIIDRWLVI
jgi:hypothetical protein